VKPPVRASFVGSGVLALLLLLAPGTAAAQSKALQTGLKIHWTEADSSGLGKPDFFPASAHAKGTFLISAVPEGPGGRIWESSDGIHWTLAWSGDLAPSFIVPAGPGFVAWSDGILLSNTGRNWTRDDGGVPSKLLTSDFPQLGSAGGVVAAFPDTGHGYWSANGHDWNSISGGPQSPKTLASDGTNLWALTGGSSFFNVPDSPVQVWMTTDGQHWTNTAQLRNSRRVSFLSAAFGPLGGVVIAGTKSWFSSDGVHWHVATNAPTVTQNGRDFVDAVVADQSGFIVAAHHDPPGCVVDPAQRVAHTWTSVDGDVWRKMSSKGWTGREIDQLFIDGRTLIGVGINWSLNDVPDGVVWTAPLPVVASDTAPPPAPIDPPGHRGC